MPTTTDLITSFTWEFYADACQRIPPQHTWFHLARMQLRTIHRHTHSQSIYRNKNGIKVKTPPNISSECTRTFIRLHMLCHAIQPQCTVNWNETFSKLSLFSAFICISKSLHTICKYFHVIAAPDQMHEALKKQTSTTKSLAVRNLFSLWNCVSPSIWFSPQTF